MASCGKKKEFELQKLKDDENKKSQPKNEKWQIISNMMGTDVRHTQRGERARWLQFVIYDVWFINEPKLTAWTMHQLEVFYYILT